MYLMLFFHFQLDEVDAEQLQILLNENILKGLDCRTLAGVTNKIRAQ